MLWTLLRTGSLPGHDVFWFYVCWMAVISGIVTEAVLFTLGWHRRHDRHGRHARL